MSDARVKARTSVTPHRARKERRMAPRSAATQPFNPSNLDRTDPTLLFCLGNAKAADAPVGNEPDAGGTESTTQVMTVPLAVSRQSSLTATVE